MKYIKISNKGLLDIRLLPLMGGTTKEDNPNTIGLFGSGAKYMLSYMIRNGLDIKVFVGEEEVKIDYVEETISDTPFKIITINGQKSSITDRMGRDWKPWYILREVWSNALDEGDAKRTITTEVGGEKDRTTIYLEASLDFLAVWNEWGKYFINEFEPIHSQNGFRLYSGSSDSIRIYKQGVLVKENKCEGGSIFSYDVDHCDINEMRELQSSVDYTAYKCITQLNSPKMIEYFLENNTEDVYEGKMDYEWTFLGSFNDAWQNTIGNAKLIHKEALDKIQARQANIDTTGTLTVSKKLYKALTKKFEGIGALRVADKVNEFYEFLEPELENRVKQAVTILEQCDYWVHPELKFVFGEFGDKNTLAKVSLDKKEILISNKFLHRPLFDICSMLIEENEHFNTGYDDESREFQQHFIDLFTQTLLAKNEIEI